MISVVHRDVYQLIMSHYDSVLVFYISDKNVLNIY